MRIRIPIIPALLAALLVATPLEAQVYRWVDERGVTNYSGTPPPDAGAVEGLGVVEDRVSVYTPDAGLVQAVEDARRGAPYAARIAHLERELEVERRARQALAAAPARVPYDPCADPRAPECIAAHAVYPAYAPVVVVPRRHRSRAIPQVALKPGTTAGQVVGGRGFIPGQSASARSFRPAPEPATPRSFTQK
jgi:hypothetical protein